MAAVPTHFNRYGEPVFARIPSPGRGWTRCDECDRTGVDASWVDVDGQLVDEPDTPRIENGVAVAVGARLTTSVCGVCDGRGWFAPRPKPPAPRIRPARDWDPCDSCDRRGGYWTEAEDGPGSSEHPGWEWSVCDDCSADREHNGVWQSVAMKPDGSFPDGLGWHPPETGTVHDQAEQRIAAQTRLYGGCLAAGSHLMTEALITMTTPTISTALGADSTDGGLWTQVADPPAKFPSTGSGGGLWHAVERTVTACPGQQAPDRTGDRAAVRGIARCGATVEVVAKFGVFDRSRRPDSTCLDCVWTVAVRTGTEDRELAWLRTQHQPGVAALAEAILAASDAPGADYERDSPATQQLLTVVSAHAPVDLIDPECAEQGCEHDRQQCPITMTACPECSVRAGPWAGEWAGTYQPECTIPGPCEVLRTLAGHYEVPLPAPAPPTVGG